MGKNIKKSIKYFIISVGILVIFPTFLFTLLRFPKVQTYLVRQITNHISEELKSTISVGNLQYSFFNRIRLSNLLIKDQHQDTLIYAEKLTAVITGVNLKRNTIGLGKVELINPVVSFITDTAGVLNLDWYLSKLKSSNDSTSAGSTFRIREVDISNARFSLINKRSKASPGSGIDLNNLQLSNINGIADNFRIGDDTTRFSIYNLSFIESSGFLVKRFDGDVLLASKDIEFSSLRLVCDSSIINMPELSLRADSSGTFGDFITDVRMNLIFDRSLLYTGDLAYFVPAFKGLKEKAWVTGKIGGTVAELRGRDIVMEYGDLSRLECDFDVSGLPSIENSFIYLGINNLKVDASDIDGINIGGKNKIVLPDVVHRIGSFTFDGSFTGFTTDFVAYGELRTRLGTIKTDISLRPQEKNEFRIRGLINGSSIALGELSNSDFLGNCSFTTDVDGIARSFREFTGSATGLIDSIGINGYKYRKVNLDGRFSDKAWDGSVKIADENFVMDLIGKLDFSDKLPNFDFTLDIKKANLFNLNFDRNDSTSSLAALVNANFTGNNIDNLDGTIKVVNSSYIKFGNPLELRDFSINTFSENGKPAINLRTDFIDADIRGYYNFGGLGNLSGSVLSAMMPARFKKPAASVSTVPNNFRFSILFKNTDKLNEFFRTGIYLAAKSTITGEISSDTLIRFKGNSKELNIHNNRFRDLSLTADYTTPGLKVGLTTSSLTLLDNSLLKDFSVNFITQPDTFNFSLNWDNRSDPVNKGLFIANGKFLNNTVPGLNPVLRINIDSSDIFIKSNQWKVRTSEVLIDSNAIEIKNIYLSNRDRFYNIDGKISGNKNDTLSLRVRGIDISPINYLITPQTGEPGQLSLAIHGILNGRISLTDIYENPLLEADITVSDFSMLESKYGNLFIKSAWNNENKVADIKAYNDLAGKRNLDINGYYDPAVKRLDLSGKADKLPIDALNPLLKSFASGISGTATGKVRLAGETDKLVLKGSLFVENGSMKIDYLQSRFKMSDSVRFANNAIIFRNLKLTDEKGSLATLNGSINHTYFKNYLPDLTINFTDCMVLNTKPKDNEYFYGTAYSTGVTTLKGTSSVLSFGISAKTGKNTKFFIPLNTSATVTDYSFVNFISHDTASQAQVIKEVPAQSTGMDLNFDLDITPDAEVQLIFDPTVGDAMKAHGSGKLNIRFDPKGNYLMSGDYLIEDGDYLFTLGNILNKSFTVENGGKITFNGDLDNAEIDLKAIYSLKTSLYELLQDENYRERIPVECQIILSGKLFNPVVKFDIYLPQADEARRSIVKNAISTEEELSRQFLYLLVMNSFYADPSIAATTPSTTTTGTSAMAVTTTEMISNQLSNWLSQISNDFDLGFLYRPGSEINNQEVEFALKTQLLNDRVTINGNFDVRGTGSQSENYDQITGDFDIETKITEKIRFKVFNRTNNPYEGKGVGYTQGISIFYRQEFDRLSDLFRKREKGDIKKEDDVVPKEN